MKKVLLASLVLTVATSLHCAEQHNDSIILNEFYSKVAPLAQERLDAFEKTGFGMRTVQTAQEKTLEERRAKITQEIEKISADTLTRLRAVNPQKYAAITTLNVPWRFNNNTQERNKALFALLKVWQDPRSESWRRLPFGFDPGNLTGKSDEELAAIADLYSPVSKKI